jgi:hypothetical protein
MALEFGAPWSRSLKRASGFALIVLMAVAAAGFLIVPARMLPVRCALVAVPACILALAFLSIVSGYVLTATQLEVERPFWNTAFPLAQLVSVAGDADVLTGSVRLLGNGGIFSFTGFFWKRGLGLYRSFATDPARAVIMRFRRFTIVVTPDDPLRFIVRVRTHLATTAANRP